MLSLSRKGISSGASKHKMTTPIPATAPSPLTSAPSPIVSSNLSRKTASTNGASSASTSQPTFKRWLHGRGHASSMLDDAATQVQEAVSNAISSEAGRWILAKRESAGNELALTSRRDGQTLSNVIDRTFIENGERWIIDYKTVRLEANVTDAQWQQQAERYRPQLKRYAELFAEEGSPIRSASFFLSHGRMVELPATSA